MLCNSNVHPGFRTCIFQHNSCGCRKPFLEDWLGHWTTKICVAPSSRMNRLCFYSVGSSGPATFPASIGHTFLPIVLSRFSAFLLKFATNECLIWASVRNGNLYLDAPPWYGSFYFSLSLETRENVTSAPDFSQMDEFAKDLSSVAGRIPFVEVANLVEKLNGITGKGQKDLRHKYFRSLLTRWTDHFEKQYGFLPYADGPETFFPCLRLLLPSFDERPTYSIQEATLTRLFRDVLGLASDSATIQKLNHWKRFVCQVRLISWFKWCLYQSEFGGFFLLQYLLPNDFALFVGSTRLWHWDAMIFFSDQKVFRGMSSTFLFGPLRSCYRNSFSAEVPMCWSSFLSGSYEQKVVWSVLPDFGEVVTWSYDESCCRKITGIHFPQEKSHRVKSKSKVNLESPRWRHF